MMELIGLSITALLVLACLLLLIFRRQDNNLGAQLTDIKSGLREDFRASREEAAVTARDNRKEINNALNDIKSGLQATLLSIIDQNRQAFETINKTLEEKITAMSARIDAGHKAAREELAHNISDFSAANIRQQDQAAKLAKEDARLVRETLSNAINGFQESFTASIKSFNEFQKEKFNQLDEKHGQLVKTTESRLETIQTTVAEKLEKTLSERLGQSFDTVGKQLMEVQKGLGEMQTLAQDVGGLKRVLSNVKMRGGFGEVQLHMLLENILAPGQYEANIATRQGSTERVEFAVKFPNKDAERDFVWLPVDAKFPKDAYEQLQHAYDTADPQQIDQAQKILESVIRKMARDICDKYLDVPNTTNFGIMFLPFEGLFAEVVRKASLLEQVQRECNVIITGPTTLAVILNSMQMGFRTLAIQKRSSEVWNILSGVKKEFSQFAGLLGKAQKNIQTGLNQLDDVVGVRTRAIQRQLKDVETLVQEGEELRVDGADEPGMIEGD